MNASITLEQFVQEHPNEVIHIMSPGGYISLVPGTPLDNLYAHAGVRGTELPIQWEELKDQVVENCNFSESDGYWYLLTVEPSLNNPIQAPEMRM